MSPKQFVCAALIGACAVSTTFAQDLSLPGPHGAGKLTVVVTRPNASTFNAILYYPATSTGANTPFDPSAAPYGGISFGHGFFQPADAYESTLQHLATWGFFVIATTTQGGLFPSHQALADDMRHGLSFLEQENVDVASPFVGAVDATAFGMTGHSMGAGASILASATDARVRALAPMAPAETNPSAIAAMSNVRIPVRLVCGTQDGTVPTATNGLPMYVGASGPRQLLSIIGGWHCGFVDTPALGGFGCDSGTLTLAQQLAIVRRHLAAFFLLHLRGVENQWNAVWGPAALTDPTTGLQRDADARFGPAAARQAGAAGHVLDFTFSLTNEGTQPTSFALFHENNLWPVTLSAMQTATLAPGGSMTIHVYVTVPSQSSFSTDRCLISARSDRDGHTRCYARIGARRL